MPSSPWYGIYADRNKVITRTWHNKRFYEIVQLGLKALIIRRELLYKREAGGSRFLISIRLFFNENVHWMVWHFWIVRQPCTSWQSTFKFSQQEFSTLSLSLFYLILLKIVAPASLAMTLENWEKCFSLRPPTQFSLTYMECRADFDYCYFWDHLTPTLNMTKRLRLPWTHYSYPLVFRQTGTQRRTYKIRQASDRLTAIVNLARLKRVIGRSNTRWGFKLQLAWAGECGVSFPLT